MKDKTTYFRRLLCSIAILLLLNGLRANAQNTFERVLTAYCESFLFITDGHVRELIELGIKGSNDSIFNSLGGMMSVSYYDAEKPRIVFSPTSGATIDFSLTIDDRDTIVCALQTACLPWCSSMIYVDNTVNAVSDNALPARKAQVSTIVKGCDPIFVSARLSDDGQSIITSNETWRMLPPDEQDQIVPQLKNDTIVIKAYYRKITEE